MVDRGDRRNSPEGEAWRFRALSVFAEQAKTKRD